MTPRPRVILRSAAVRQRMRDQLRRRVSGIRRKNSQLSFQSFEQVETSLNGNGNALKIEENLLMYYNVSDALLLARDLTTELEVPVCYDASCESYVSLRSCVSERHPDGGHSQVAEPVHSQVAEPVHSQVAEPVHSQVAEPVIPICSPSSLASSPSSSSSSSPSSSSNSIDLSSESSRKVVRLVGDHLVPIVKVQWSKRRNFRGRVIQPFLNSVLKAVAPDCDVKLPDLSIPSDVWEKILQYIRDKTSNNKSCAVHLLGQKGNKKLAIISVTSCSRILYRLYVGEKNVPSGCFILCLTPGCMSLSESQSLNWKEKRDRYYVYCKHCKLDIQRLVMAQESNFQFEESGLYFSSPSDLSRHPLTVEFGFFVATEPIPWSDRHPRSNREARFRTALNSILKRLFPTKNYRVPDLNIPETVWTQLKNFIFENQSSLGYYTFVVDSEKGQFVHLRIADPCTRIVYKNSSTNEKKTSANYFLCFTTGCATNCKGMAFKRGKSNAFSIYCASCRTDIIKWLKRCQRE